jgi:hypothetical protein
MSDDSDARCSIVDDRCRKAKKRKEKKCREDCIIASEVQNREMFGDDRLMEDLCSPVYKFKMRNENLPSNLQRGTNARSVIDSRQQTRTPNSCHDRHRCNVVFF